MSQSLYHRIASVAESSYGVTPSPPTLEVLEGTSSTPALSVPKMASTTIRNDGNIKEMVRMNRAASFSRSQELVFPTINEGLYYELRAVMREETEAAAVAAAETCTLVNGGNTITRAGGVGDFVSEGFQPGDVVITAGATAAADNGYFRVTNVATTTLTVQIPDSGTFSNPDALSSLGRGARMTNGVYNTARSFSIEEVWTDTQKMIVWTGQRVASITAGFAMGTKSNVSVQYVGKDADPDTDMQNDVTTSGLRRGIADVSDYNVYTESPVFSTADPILVIVNGLTIPAQSFSVTVGSSARVRHDTSAGATPGAAPTGTTQVRVQLTAYASLLSHLQEYRDGTAVPVMVMMDDPAGKAFGFTMGAVEWDSASLPTSGPDQDAIISVSGMATLTAKQTGLTGDEDYTIKMHRFV